MAVIVRKNPFEPMVASLKVMPPALTGGLLIFMTILFFVGVANPDLNDSLKLQKSTFSNLELNRLTFYPMLHLSLLHLCLNGWALLPLLSSFELQNGTVRTGIVLNCLGTVTGVSYILLSFVFFPNSAVLGSSAWVFSFLAYFSYQESKHTPYIYLTQNFRIPTLSKPLILLTATALLVPGSSIIGHLLGVFAGWLLALGKLKFMTDPPSKVVLFIESKLDRLIALIPAQVQYIKEVDAIELRKSAANASGNILPLAELAPTTTVTNNNHIVTTASAASLGGPTVAAAGPPVGSSGILSPTPVSAIPLGAGLVATAGESVFKGEGHVLGSVSSSDDFYEV